MTTAVRITEAAFQAQVTELAELLGWTWVHFRPARTQHGWATPVSGPMGKGWPDLVLVRVRDHRLLFVELKRDGERPTLAQQAVLELLHDALGDEKTSVHVWRPADWDRIEMILR